jgi:hypothetical protein
MISPLQALQAAQKNQAAPAARPRLLIAGATGALGHEVLRRLVGGRRFAHTWVMAKEPIKLGFTGVECAPAATNLIADWPLLPVQVAAVMFEPPRMFYQRERALWVPAPQELLALAAWLRRCGVHTLVLVLPHAQGSLPQALRAGLANLDEAAVVALGFERVLIMRSARKESARVATKTIANRLQNLAHWMLSTVHYMVPSNQQPVRARKLAEFVDAALQTLLARQLRGTFVASPELLHHSAQGAAQQTVQNAVDQWLAKSTHGD